MKLSMCIFLCLIASLAFTSVVIADPEDDQMLLVWNPVGSNPFDDEGLDSQNQGMTGDEEELQTDSDWLEEWLENPWYEMTWGPIIVFAGTYESAPSTEYPDIPAPEYINCWEEQYANTEQCY